MTMNANQRIALWLGAALTGAALMFPPMHLQGERGAKRGHHIGALVVILPLDDNGYRHTVNHALLLVELIGIALAAALSCAALSSPKQ